jgi:hypothetical protein
MPVMMRDVLDGEDWGAELSLTCPTPLVTRPDPRWS